LSRKKTLVHFEFVAGPHCFAELIDAKTPATWAALASRLRPYLKWCRTTGVAPFPPQPERLRDYAHHLFGKKISGTSMGVYLAAISTAARLRGHRVDQQLTSELLKAARRRSGPPRQAHPLRGSDLAGIRDLLDLNRLRDLRDAVALFLAFAVAGRGSEVVSVDWLHAGGSRSGGDGVLTVERGGLRVTWSRTKTSQRRASRWAFLIQISPSCARWCCDGCRPPASSRASLSCAPSTRPARLCAPDSSRTS
jgi:hypothetical protein